MAENYAIENKKILTNMGPDFKEILTNLFGTKNRYVIPKDSEKKVEKVFANVLQYAEKHAKELSTQTGISADYLLECVGHKPKIINDFRQEYIHAKENLEAIATIKTAAKKKAINLKNLTAAELNAVELYVTGKLNTQEKYLIALTETPIWEFADDEINGLKAALGAAAMREFVPSHYRAQFENYLSTLIGTDEIANITTSTPKKSMWTEEAATAHLLSKGIPPGAAKKIVTVLLIAGIVLASGCADVTAPETTIDSLDAPGYYNDDINELAADIIHNTERTEDPNVFEKGGMKIRLEKYDGTEEIYAITYTDHVGNSLIVKENDNSNGCIVDEVHIINEDGTTLVPKPQAEAVTPVGAELYKELLAQDNPEEFKKLLGMDINDLKITGLGTPDEGSLKVAAEGGRTTLRWDADYNENLEPKTGLTKYIESYDGRLTNLMFKRGNDGFGVLDKKGNDEKIDMVEIRINGQEFQFES